MRLIECRRCDARNCEGCNILTLTEMLHKGKLDCLMDEHRSIVIAPESLRPKGRWIESEPGYRLCSHCMADVAIYSGHTNYCPNCGAKMEV